jgi:hypothetical protein
VPQPGRQVLVGKSPHTEPLTVRIGHHKIIEDTVEHQVGGEHQCTTAEARGLQSLGIEGHADCLVVGLVLDPVVGIVERLAYEQI